MFIRQIGDSYYLCVKKSKNVFLVKDNNGYGNVNGIYCPKVFIGKRIMFKVIRLEESIV